MISNDLESLVLGLGISFTDYPASLTECFNAKGAETKKILENNLSAISGTLGKILMRYDDLHKMAPETLFEKVLLEPQLIKSKIYQAAPSMVSSGLKKAIAFKIIQKHPEINESQPLRIIRERIEANANITRACAKGAHKGHATNEIMAAVTEANHNHTTFAMLERGALMRYVAKQALANGCAEAKTLLLSIFKDENKLLQIEAQ